jgi:tRNA(Ile)-lysidine synthase
VESLSIDHGLQASSNDMSRRCQIVAESMGVRHTTATIPWSCGPFPPLPAPGEAFENLARHARYHLLFHAMTRMGAQTIALGHHADDQVETALMRIAKGTTELGVGGMRRCRRWGMGLGREEGSLGWAGSEGMRRWIVRPLVSISKVRVLVIIHRLCAPLSELMSQDRLLATCEENKLDYVLDPTNFQPEVTLRNAVREMIHRRTPHASGEEVRLSSSTCIFF